MSDPRLVEVQWHDAGMSGGWFDDHETLEDTPVKTVGYLFEEDAAKIQLAQSITRGQRGNLIIIPKGMVVSVVDLAVVRKAPAVGKSTTVPDVISGAESGA